MRKRKIILLFCFALTLIFCTCHDPVFYTISLEVKPIEPLIKGAATNFVIYDNRVFVASGNTVYTYNKGIDGGKAYWDKETSPGGNILQIASTTASTGQTLYALCATDKNNDGKTVVKRFDKDNSSWTVITGIVDDFKKLQNIFAVNDILFISASNSTNTSISYTVLYIDDSETVKKLSTKDADFQDNSNNTGEVNGAAYNGTSYFLSTKSTGVYKTDNLEEGAQLLRYKDETGTDLKINFSGIITLQDDESTVLLIARNGSVYTVKDSITKIENVSMGKMATGALFIYRKPPDPENELAETFSLLLAGRQDSLVYSVSYGYTYGYMELELDAAGIAAGSNFIEPGKAARSTVIKYELYQSTIGKYPINYFMQVPYEIDNEMTLFAATQKSGVWSYRERGGVFQWNAEE